MAVKRKFAKAMPQSEAGVDDAFGKPISKSRNLSLEQKAPLVEKCVSDYPRPQLRRDSFYDLNGQWKFAFDDRGVFKKPSDLTCWPLVIEVPFSPESVKSGIHDTGFHKSFWYEKEFEFTASPEERIILHFGAVDYEAQVWVNHVAVGTHRGGFSPFCFDITEALKPSGLQVITVLAKDDPFDLAKPRGKQDWKLEPHSIWYPRTSGIWQTVWIEAVAQTYITQLKWTPYFEGWEIGCEVFLNQEPRFTENELQELTINIKLKAADLLLADDTYRVFKSELHRRLSLPDPGIDDFRNELLWSPERPNLIEATIDLFENGKLIDRVHSYTALRSVATHRDQFLLNGRPYYMRLVLDQGYWPDTLMTPLSFEALQKDVELVKSMGFNGVRKHQKAEDPRYLFLADKLGLLVWGEMPSPYRFSTSAVERLISEWSEIIKRDYSHPSVVVWVPFNESWGVPDLEEKAAHRHCVQSLYHLTKTLDPTRPVIGNDGWETSATDIIGIHDYDKNPAALQERYGNTKILELLQGRIPAAGRVMTLENYEHTGQPLVLSEFGGIAFSENKNATNLWGYTACSTREDFKNKYLKLLQAVKEIKIFSGFCYTQLTDTFQEANGLLYADRSPKVPLLFIKNATLKAGFTIEEVELEMGISQSRLFEPTQDV